MKLCSETFNKFTLFFSQLNITSNIFYLVAGIIFLIKKFYFFGIYLVMITIISSLHHYYNNNLVSCKDIKAKNIHTYLSKMDVISVNIFLVIMVIYLIYIKKNKKLFHLIIIFVIGIIGIVLFFYSEYIYYKYTKDEVNYNKIKNEINEKKDEIINIKRNIIFNKILFVAVHSIWHIITGLVGVIIAFYLIDN